MSAGQVRGRPGGIDAAARAVCDHRGDRLGSYKRIFDRWLAVDRLGRPIGQFETEQAAYDAVSAAGAADDPRNAR
jgi:hypothetical protein